MNIQNYPKDDPRFIPDETKILWTMDCGSSTGVSLQPTKPMTKRQVKQVLVRRNIAHRHKYRAQERLVRRNYKLHPGSPKN